MTNRFKPFLPLAFSFSNLFNDLETLSKRSYSYPPCNIKQCENDYLLEFAVAGFELDDLTVEETNNMLRVSGQQKEADDEYVMLQQGISEKDFSLTYPLKDDIKIEDCELSNGVLKIKLVQIPAANNSPTKVKINKS